MMDLKFSFCTNSNVLRDKFNRIMNININHSDDYIGGKKRLPQSDFDQVTQLIDHLL